MTATNRATRAVHTAVTDESGTYRLLLLPVGTYTVAVELQGFKKYSRTEVRLEIGKTTTLDIQLEVGGMEETVTVSGASPIVDVQSVRRQTVIDDEIINAIPGTRHYTSLMQLMPNTVTAGGAATGAYAGAGRSPGCARWTPPCRWIPPWPCSPTLAWSVSPPSESRRMAQPSWAAIGAPPAP